MGAEASKPAMHAPMVIVAHMVETVIKLAARWAREEEALAARFDPQDLGFDLEREVQRAYIEAKRPAQDELREHLDSLPDAVIGDLCTLMEAGKSGDPALLCDKGCPVSRNEAAEQLLTKLPLSEHLERGLALAEGSNAPLPKSGEHLMSRPQTSAPRPSKR